MPGTRGFFDYETSVVSTTVTLIVVSAGELLAKARPHGRPQDDVTKSVLSSSALAVGALTTVVVDVVEEEAPDAELVANDVSTVGSTKNGILNIIHSPILI